MGQNPGKSGLHIKILEMYGCSSPEESELQLLIHIELGGTQNWFWVQAMLYDPLAK
jgi:hypothetical protein